MSITPGRPKPGTSPRATPGHARSHGRRRQVDWMPPQLPMAVVMAIAGFGFVRVLVEHWRQGTTLIGAALLVAGVIRALLPQDRSGLLAVRSQGMDVVCYLGLGVLVVVLAATVPRTPFIVQ